MLYKAPEMLTATTSEPYNEKIDVWALGVIAFYLLSGGNFPFKSKYKAEVEQFIKENAPPMELLGECSDLARNFVEKCLNKDKGDRPSAKDLTNDDWFRAFKERRLEQGKQSMKAISKNLVQFAVMNKF